MASPRNRARSGVRAEKVPTSRKRNGVTRHRTTRSEAAVYEVGCQASSGAFADSLRPARTVRAAALGAVASLPLSSTAFFSRRRSPRTTGEGRAAAGKERSAALCRAPRRGPTRLPGRLACPQPRHNARTTVYPCGTGHGPSTLYRVRPWRPARLSSRAHPSNERCLSRITRRQNGGPLRPHRTSSDLIGPHGDGDVCSLCLLGRSLVSLLPPPLTPPLPAPG